MPMYTRKRQEYTSHPTVVSRSINVVTKLKYLGVFLDSKLDWYPHTQYLEDRILRIRNNLIRCSKATWGISFHNMITIYKYALLPVIHYASEAWYISISNRAKLKLQQIQRSALIFATKAYRTVSNEALQAIAGQMPIELEMLRYKDNIAISKGLPTNAVIADLKKVEIPIKTSRIHPEENIINVTTTGEGHANILIYTDGSKTESHVGAGMTAVKDSKEFYFDARRLNLHCTVYQAELYAINMAIEWIENHQNRPPSFAIHVDSMAALLAIKDRQATHPLAVKIRTKVINLRTSTQITFHWVQGHTGLEGNERADYLAKVAASYKHATSYNAVPRSTGKKMLDDYYTTIWNAAYTNSEKAAQTKLFIPTIPYRLSLSLSPNHILTQFLTNHGSFRQYLFKMNKVPSPNCNCPESPAQTAIHLLTECTMFSRDRPAALKTIPLPLMLKYHINTVTVTNFLQHIFRKLKE